VGNFAFAGPFGLSETEPSELLLALLRGFRLESLGVLSRLRRPDDAADGASRSQLEPSSRAAPLRQRRVPLERSEELPPELSAREDLDFWLWAHKSGNER